MPRVKQIVQKTDIAPEHYALFDELAALRGVISGPSTIVLHSPPLARPWNEVSEYLHRKSIVEDRYAEVAVCAAAREKDCGYIFTAHARMARNAGVDDAVITVVRDREPASSLPPDLAPVVTYARQLMQDNRVAQDVFDQLLQAHGAPWLVELTIWIGRYAALAGIINGFEVVSESSADPLPVPGANSPTAKQPAPPPLAQPRIPLLTERGQVPPEHQGAFAAFMAIRGGLRGPYPILMHSPIPCNLINDVHSYVRSQSPIERRHQELAIITIAREKDCSYIWSVHAPHARTEGLSDAAVTAIGNGGEVAALSAVERDIVDYIRQQLRSQRVTQELFDRLSEQLGVPWLVELTALLGHYGILCSIINAFEVAPEPGSEGLPLG